MTSRKRRTPVAPELPPSIRSLRQGAGEIDRCRASAAVDDQRGLSEGGRVLEAARGAGGPPGAKRPIGLARASLEPEADAGDDAGHALDAALENARARARQRCGLPPVGSNGGRVFERFLSGQLQAEPEPPRLAAKKLRRRIRRYLELACPDTCAETGCTWKARFWDGRCDRHALAAPARGQRIDPEQYELLWSEFFRLASDESLGQPGNDGVRDRGQGQLAAFSSVRWDRFRHPGAGAGASTLDDDAPECDGPEPDVTALKERIASYTALFADQEDDGA